MTISLWAGLTDAIVPNPSDLRLLTYWAWSADTTDNVGIHWDIDWGDGGAHDTGLSLTDRVAIPQRVALDFHNYLTPGTYTISVHFTATSADMSGGGGYPDIDETATVSVTVREPETLAPSADSGDAPLAVSLGGSFLVPVPVADDRTYEPDPAGTYPVSIDWGDGSTLMTGTTDAGTFPRGFLYDAFAFFPTVMLSHTYELGGAFTVTLSVFPALGGGGAFVTKTFTITITGKVALSLSAKNGPATYTFTS